MRTFMPSHLLQVSTEEGRQDIDAAALREDAGAMGPSAAAAMDFQQTSGDKGSAKVSPLVNSLCSLDIIM